MKTERRPRMFSTLPFSARTALALLAGLGVASCGGQAPETEIESVSQAITIDTSAIYTLTGLQSGKCMEPQNGSTASLAPLVIAPCTGSTRQQFQMVAKDSGYYQMRNVKSGLCVDVSGASTADGASVIQYACGTGTNQQWSFTDVTGGQRVTARHSGKVLDVKGRATADGTVLDQYPWQSGSNQIFKLQTVKPSAGCGKTRTLQNGQLGLISSGMSRSYILKAPSDYDNTRPYRLVFAYHWNGGSAQNVADGTSMTGTSFYGLSSLAGNSTIFIAPQGLSNGWANVGGRDVVLTDDILTQVQNNLCIDTSRVFATGFSYGAGMTYALACARPNVFRGVAVYAGANLSGCAGGTSPVAYYATQGVTDATITFTMGAALRDKFVSLNGCTAQTPAKPATGSGTHICTTYSGCSSGHPVTWCAFDGGHTPAPLDLGQTTSWNPQQSWNFITQF